QTNVIDVHISRLRRKMDQGFERPFLETLRGAGYVIRTSDPEGSGTTPPSASMS
ncbi:MAG: winged helix-turn-helix domain-containing protein, partial [Rhodospirillaceae bacterium]